MYCTGDKKIKIKKNNNNTTASIKSKNNGIRVFPSILDYLGR
jgi:hypothetical protein